MSRPRWLNEGIATWSETQGASAERAIVEQEASGAGLFSFDAITEQFPIGERGGRLSYAQGTTMIDMIIAGYGREAIAGIAAAYREGASDAEALEAGTGVAGRRAVRRRSSPSSGSTSRRRSSRSRSRPRTSTGRPPAPSTPAASTPGAEPPPGDAVPGEGGPSTSGSEVAVVVALGIGLAAAAVGALAMSRRAERRSRA